jgi:hypothetical protein
MATNSFAREKLRIPAKLTDESGDVDRDANRGAWSSDFIVIGQHGG